MLWILHLNVYIAFIQNYRCLFLSTIHYKPFVLGVIFTNLTYLVRVSNLAVLFRISLQIRAILYKVFWWLKQCELVSSPRRWQIWIYLHDCRYSLAAAGIFESRGWSLRFVDFLFKYRALLVASRRCLVVILVFYFVFIIVYYHERSWCFALLVVPSLLAKFQLIYVLHLIRK